jgi:hypothetical protein
VAYNWDEVDYSGWTDGEIKVAADSPWSALRTFFQNLGPREVKVGWFTVETSVTTGEMAGQVLNVLKRFGWDVPAMQAELASLRAENEELRRDLDQADEVLGKLARRGSV